MKLIQLSSALKSFKRMIIGKKTDSAVNVVPGAQASQTAAKKEISREIEDNGLFFVITGPNKTLKCGSVHALLNYLIDVKMNDLGFIYAFLLHHVAFIKSWNLLEILLEKWKERAEDHSEHAKAEVFRVANVLKFWIDNFFLDMKSDPKMVEYVTEFFNSQSQDFRANGLFVILAETVKQKLISDPLHKKMIIINPPKSWKPTATFKANHPEAFSQAPGESPFVLLDFEAIELARQLSLMDFQSFQAIEAREYLDSNWKKKEKLNVCPNICKLALWSTSVSNWLISEILAVNDINHRAATIDRIISVSNELVKIKNFNSVRMILGVIFAPCITRLRKTFNLLSKKSRDTLEDLKSLVSDKDDYQKLREKIKMLNPPLIPYPELYYKDLGSHDKSGALLAERNGETWINVEKMVGVAFVIKGIQNYQKSRFHFDPVDEIQDHIKAYRKLTSKEADEASAQLEA